MRVKPPNPKNPSSDNSHLTVPHICTTIRDVYLLVPDRRIRATIKPTLGERNKDQYVDGNHGQIKVTETIGGRVGRYNFSPTLISPGQGVSNVPSTRLTPSRHF